MQRTTLAEVVNTAAFIASDRAGAMTATDTNLSASSITDQRPRHEDLRMHAPVCCASKRVPA